jgi:peptidoglycan DL-endopeptidase CwlO
MRFSPRMAVVTAAVSIILSGLPAHAGTAPRRDLSQRLRLHAFGDGVKSLLTDEDDRHSGSSKHSRKHRRSSHHQARSHPEEQANQDENSTKAGKGSTPSERPKATPTPTPTPEPKPSPTPSPRSRASAVAGENTGEKGPAATVPAQVSSLRPDALKEYASQPPKVQELIRESLALTEQNLAYTYGSNDPANGGMDCSGFIYYVLQRLGFHDVPRDSSEQYLWVRKYSDFHAVLSRRQDTFELDELRPGDLLFWSGTYGVNRDVPVTHVMIYLGKDKKSGKPLMAGSSDGRTYNGMPRYGVSVFDFTLPNGQPSKNDPDRTPRFDGYATIPGLRPSSNLARNNQAQTQASPPAETPTPTPTPSPSPAHHHKRRSHED